MEGMPNPKARNLFATSAVVLGSQFLELKIPSAVLSSLQATSEVPIWKIWALVTTVLAFQLWRLLTDSRALITAATEDAKAIFLRRKADLLKMAFKRQAAGKRCWGIGLDLPEHARSVGTPQDISVYEQVNGMETGLTPLLTAGVAAFNWLEFSPNGQGRVEATVPYRFTRLRRAEVELSSFAKGCVTSAAYQDILVPIVTGLVATGLSIYKTAAWIATA